MDFAGSQSERFVDPSSSEAQANHSAASEVWSVEPAFMDEPPTLPVPPEQRPGMAFGVTAPLPPLPAAGAVPAPPAASGSASVFRVDQERLAALRDLNWRRARALLIVLVVGIALGMLLLIPAVHQPAVQPIKHSTALAHPGQPKPVWASILLVVSVVAPLLALAVGLLALPFLLWRAAWLSRQRDLHLAIGRQGLFFFLPGQAGRWFLLPWGHITGLTDATAAPASARRQRRRTVLWRRWARLRRVFRRGRHLGNVSLAGARSRSPFLARARAAMPQQRLRVVCYARLPDSGYSWLFGLAPFTRRVGAATFLLESGWFAPALSAPVNGSHASAPQGVSLQRVLLDLWAASLARAERPALPLPRTRGAVLLNTSAPAQEAGPEARRVDGAAWAALPLVPALSVATVIITIVTHQPLGTGMVLNLAALCVLTLALGLLLAGTPLRGRVFASGAFLLVLAGALNLAYGVAALLQTWPWSIQTAPGEPFFFLEALASLLLIFGGMALGLEGSGRPGVPPAAAQSAGAGLSARPHSTELVVALGLLALGLARILEDIDLAALSSGATTLQWLRYTLAEPLLPLAIIGLSYFAALGGPALHNIFRALQAIYGLALGLLVPAAFILVYRATGNGSPPLPLEWLPLLIVELICGLAVVVFSIRRGHPRAAEQRSRSA